MDVGIARGAIDDTIKFVRDQARPWIDSGKDRAADDPYTIAEIGDLKIKLHAAEALLRRSGLAVDAAVANPTADTVAAASIAVAEAKVLTTEIALLATNKIFELGGARSTLLKHNLDRHWRNARVHTVHDPGAVEIPDRRQLLPQSGASAAPRVDLAKRGAQSDESARLEKTDGVRP